ncbi:hypothetical protein V6M85_02200 [Sulfolobus tengchongensis]|uniref:Uncharacterized protein n=1 Tax=Sulfolobus tengchongensis TaxID=207809 RepID=A0AAX4L196_9CREN
MNAKLPIILTIIIVISAVVIVFATTQNAMKANNSNNSTDSPYTLSQYTTLGIIHTYNISPITNFIAYYTNNSNVSLVLSLASQIIGNGTVKVVKVDNSYYALLGYFKASSPLSSFAFSVINETLVKHGFNFSQYNSLLYDYKNNTAFGFDGYYFYVVKDNTSRNTTIFLLKYLYTSEKVFTPQPSQNVVMYGYVNGSNFTLVSMPNQLILKANTSYYNITHFLKYFNITIGNFSVAGKVVLKTSNIVIYSVNATYDGKELYAMMGIKNDGNNRMSDVIILSQEKISLNEVLNEL